MVTKHPKSRRKEVEHALLCIEVNSFEASSEASLNFALRHGHSIFSRSDDLAFEFATSLTISGVCIQPTKRVRESYRLNITGNEPHAGQLTATLRDFQAQDESGLPQHRLYRGAQIPIYDGPPGIGRLERNRGTNTWDAWLWVFPRLVSDMLCLLTQMKPLYATLHERKAGRDRWVQSFSLQTAKPDEE